MSSSHNVIVSLLYVVLSSHYVAGQWFFALSRCQLLSRMMQVISL